MNTTKIVSWLTAASVLVIAVISFILSYTALYEVGYSNGVSEDLSYLWPLLIDVPLIVYSLSVVNAYLHSESNWKQWTLVSVYTGLTIFFNILHTGIEFPYSEIVTPVIVAIIAPVSLFFSFEMLMGQLRNGVKRSELYKSIKDLSNEFITKKEEYNNLIVSKQAELENIISDKQVELNDIITGYNTTITQLEQTIIQREADLVAIEASLDSIDITSKEEAQAKMLEFIKHNPDASADEIGEHIGKSKPTVYNYFRELKEKAIVSKNGDGWEVN